MRLRLIISLLLATVTVVAFQNCGRVAVSESIETSLSSLSASLQFHEITVLVDVNQPKKVDLNSQMSFQGSVSFEENGVVSRLEIPGEGVAEISATNRGELIFTPAYGFRGTSHANLFVRQGSAQIQVIKLIFEVRNPLRDIKPSLAVRAGECLLCHAQIKGDVISDFGFKSSFDTRGSDHFIRPRWAGATNDTSAYAPFHSGADPANSGWMTATIKGNLIVPQVRFDSLPAVERLFLIAKDSTQTLREYLRVKIFPTSAPARVDNIIEKKLIYIGAPTEASIKTAGRLNAGTPLTFLKNNADSPELSGFKHFTNNGLVGGKDFYANEINQVMRCEGDLFVDGVVWLRNLQIQTEQGCRIHSTKTVFISGPIEYVDESALTNLQIVSSRAIYMGAGVCIDCYQGADDYFKDADGNGVVDGDDPGHHEYGSNWAISRAANAASVANNLRGRTEMGTYPAEIQTDFLKVSNQLGAWDQNLANMPRLPAGTTIAAGRAYYEAKLAAAGVVLVDPYSRDGLRKTLNWDEAKTPYRRLLLNAPDVQSRYNGDFQGWVIAEYALWRLGSFSFKFDPVFKAVPIFPLMNIDEILKIQE